MEFPIKELQIDVDIELSTKNHRRANHSALVLFTRHKNPQNYIFINHELRVLLQGEFSTCLW
jgi:hypothetical protein